MKKETIKILVDNIEFEIEPNELMIYVDHNNKDQRNLFESDSIEFRCFLQAMNELKKEKQSFTERRKLEILQMYKNEILEKLNTYESK